MENTTKSISTDLFYKIRSRFTGLSLGDANGQLTIVPEDAVFFDFDYVDNEAPVGHVSISIAEQGTMKVYYSENITETMDSMQKNNWYDFLRELRAFAKGRLMSFDTRDITKDTLNKTDFKFLSQNTQVGESIMSEASMYGTKKTSFQKLENTRLIIKHSHALPEEMKPGARSRNISALFVENADGERFKYPFIHLSGARAMQRHVANGGLPYDDIGKSIIQMSEEIAQLKSFGNYVVKNDLMNGNNSNIVERSQQQLNNLRETLAKLAKQGHYQAYKESFQAVNQTEVPEDVIEDFTEKFTVKNFKEDIKSVFPVLYRLMQEENGVGYNDIVDMTTTEANTEDIDLGEEIEITDFDKFENWVMGLGESSPIQSDDIEEQSSAVQNLQELVGDLFPAGTGGTNAIMSLKGIINDPELNREIKEQSREDANFDVRGLVHTWLEANAPEVLEKLDFGDYESQATIDQATAPAEEPATEVPQEGAEEQEQGHGLNIRELAEFIHSFYDKETGSFPKGPEGIAIMVGKKFGEQAERAARKLVEKMAPHQTTEQNPELAELVQDQEEQPDELSRIKKLSGM